MSHGVAAIACLPNGVVDVIDDPSTGFLIPANDSAALSEKLLYLLHQPSEMHAMGLRGRKRYDTVFAMPHNIARLRKIYAEL